MNSVNWQEDLDPSQREEAAIEQPDAGLSAFRIKASQFVRTVFIACISIEILLVLLDAALYYHRWISIPQIRRIFKITDEISVGTWFSVTQSFVVAALAILVFLGLRTRGASRLRRLGWVFIAAFFLFMSVDDAAKVHERVGSGVKTYHNSVLLETGKLTTGASFFQKWPTYAWQVVVGPFYVASALFLIFFFWREFPPWSTRLALLLGFTCWAIAVGLDFVEGVEGLHQRIADFGAMKEETIRHFSKSAEEFIEMLGTTLFLVTFLDHFIEENEVMSIRFVR